MPDLLLELFSEEIPARMQTRAAADLKRLVTDNLVEAGLTYGAAEALVTPRRLTLAIEDLPARTPDRREERKGPRTDAPDKALDGFLRSTGVTRDALEVRDDKKGAVYFAIIERPGQPAAAVVTDAVEAAIRSFPWPKSMRWGSGSLRWVRPLHRILCILSTDAGSETVPIEIDGIVAADLTEGHRFLAPEPIHVTGFEDYAAKLEAAHVVLDSAHRADRIEHDAKQAAFALGMELVEDKSLLAEVAGLVEWPVVLVGEIDAAFLDLPPEVLQTSMREHQKFFSLRNTSTGRIERFVLVANTVTPDDGATIIAGNRRVLSARLADAKFFWENDLRTVGEGGMDALGKPLEAVTFHSKLGTQSERVLRIAALARDIAPHVGADPDRSEKAARVCKSDLSSEMVYEFPELQGTMGRYYAEAAGLGSDIAAACEEHYAPLGPSDQVPTSSVSLAVGLADKIDMLSGFWAIDEKPTGSKDPFALRRAALGVIRTLLDGSFRISIDRVFDAQVLRHQIEPGDADEEKLLAQLLEAVVSEGMFGERTRALLTQHAETGPDWLMSLINHDPTISDDLRNFFHDRLKVHLRGANVRHDVIDAGLEMPDNCDLVLLVKRVQALQGFLETEEGMNLLAGYKRASNIVGAEEAKDGVEYSGTPEDRFAEHDEERAVFAALDAAEPAIASALGEEDFAAAMTEMAKLRKPIDAFFDKVTVNTENQIVRRNRLCLLTRVCAVMRQVAVWDVVEG